MQLKMPNRRGMDMSRRAFLVWEVWRWNNLINWNVW